MKIKTHVKGGLPVIARASIHTAEWMGRKERYVDEIELFFLNGYPIKFPIPFDDEERITEEVMYAHRINAY